MYCLISILRPHFNPEFIDGTCLTRFSNGNLALVPGATQLGDSSFHSLKGYVRELLLFRRCKKPENSATDSTIRSEVQNRASLYGEELAVESSKGPLVDFTLIGPVFTRGSEFVETSDEDRIVDRDFWGEEGKKLVEGNEWPKTGFLIY